MATNESITSAIKGAETDSKPQSIASAVNSAARPKRVRTGCLTCRERHLKCDEGIPDCQNCKKSNRDCKRGVRLNFIDTQVKTPPVTPPTDQWKLSFQDESRDIASEYKGGLGRYQNIATEMEQVNIKEEIPYDFAPPMSEPMLDAPDLVMETLPTLPPPRQFHDLNGYPNSIHDVRDQQNDHQPEAAQTSDFMTSVPSYANGGPDLVQAHNARATLTDPQELLCLQVFVEEVGSWMDSMDPYKHFSRLLPFDSLNEPMLLNAFLACGARHLNLVNPVVYEDEAAAQYYSTSSNLLLRQVNNPYRDTFVCATTAVILNVYETMTQSALQRMNHIAGARALIKECGWNATSVGIGSACFWLNVGMELLSCLHFNWQVAWDPDKWGVDMNFDHHTEPGREEIWTQRIVWIVAKIANFRASMTIRQGEAPMDQIRLHAKYEEWKRWKDWIDGWELNSPRTMKPVGYLPVSRLAGKSCFPEIWLIKRTSKIARMFYYTGICLLCQTNPLSLSNPQVMQQMHDLELHTARDLCGVIAHEKDRGVSSVALRSLAHAGECLTDRREQDEVFEIFDRISKNTGWRIAFIVDSLKKKWGRTNEFKSPGSASLTGFGSSSTTSSLSGSRTLGSAGSGSSLSGSTSALPPPPKLPPMGIVNPQFAKADFSHADHPYQNYYVPPIQAPVHQPFTSHFQ